MKVVSVATESIWSFSLKKVPFLFTFISEGYHTRKEPIVVIQF